MALVVLDAAIANVALPTVARSLQVTPASSILIVTAYQMALVMALLPCAALGESLGYRLVFRAGVALFTGASLACALAPSLPWLLAARFVQGLGGAALLPLYGDPRPLLLAVALCGFGFGLFNVPNNRNMFLSASRERSGAAGGMQGTARLLGQTAGAVTMTLLFTLTSVDAAPRIGLGIGAVMSLAAGLISALHSSFCSTGREPLPTRQCRPPRDFAANGRPTTCPE